MLEYLRLYGNKSLRPTCASRSAPRSRVSFCTLVCSQCSCARCASAGCRCGRRALGGASAFPRALPAAASPSCCTAAFHRPMTSCFRKPIALTCLSRRGASGCAWPGSCHFLHSSRCPRGRVVKGVSLDFVRALRAVPLCCPPVHAAALGAVRKPSPAHRWSGRLVRHGHLSTADSAHCRQAGARRRTHHFAACKPSTHGVPRGETSREASQSPRVSQRRPRSECRRGGTRRQHARENNRFTES